MTPYHASNTLYRGEARDVRHALQLMVEQYECEAGVCSGDSDQHDLAQTMQAAADKARKMLAEYNAAVKAAERELILNWASADDPEVSEWAVKLDLGAFDQLAV